MADIAIIKATAIFLSLSSSYPSAEVWPDKDFNEGGYSYYWAVGQSGNITKILSYFRCKGGQCEQRTYGPDGNDLWVIAK